MELDVFLFNSQAKKMPDFLNIGLSTNMFIILLAKFVSCQCYGWGSMIPARDQIF